MFDKRPGVAQSKIEAARWYRKAADQGVAVAERNLGRLYYEGRGVEKNYQEAVRWWQKASKQGDKLAQRALEELQ